VSHGRDTLARHLSRLVGEKLAGTPSADYFLTGRFLKRAARRTAIRSETQMRDRTTARTPTPETRGELTPQEAQSPAWRATASRTPSAAPACTSADALSSTTFARSSPSPKSAHATNSTARCHQSRPPRTPAGRAGSGCAPRSAPWRPDVFRRSKPSTPTWGKQPVSCRDFIGEKIAGILTSRPHTYSPWDRASTEPSVTKSVMCDLTNPSRSVNIHVWRSPSFNWPTDSATKRTPTASLRTCGGAVSRSARTVARIARTS